MSKKLPIKIFAISCFIILTSSWAALAQTHQATSLPKVLVLGDSLSAAYGFNPQEGWVQLLANRLKDQAQVINASVSGETTSGGLTRLPNLLKDYKPNLLLLELGANDGLRGLPPEKIQENLEKIIHLSQAEGAQLVLLGIYLPRNYGASYINQFEAIYPRLAEKYSLPYHPFLLTGVAENNHLMQNDGLHPKAESQPIILNNVWPLVKSFFQITNQQQDIRRSL